MIVEKSGEEGEDCCSRMLREGYGVSFWKAIRKRWEVFKSKVPSIVGNGRRVKFWNNCLDPLLCIISLKGLEFI